MKIKRLQFRNVPHVLKDYEEADAGCLVARIWREPDRCEAPGIFKITLETGRGQVDSRSISISDTFMQYAREEILEQLHSRMHKMAQEMFEKYIKENFLLEDD